MNTLFGGCLPSLQDRRTLAFASYAARTLPKSPKSCSWWKVKPSTAWGMDGNDKYGLCVIATAAHMIDSARANDAHDLTRIPDQEVIRLARKMGALRGYYILDRLKYWKKRTMFNEALVGYVQVPLKDHEALKYVVYNFGAADVGAFMPKAWTENKSLWSTGKGSDYAKRTNTGHSFCLLGYGTSKTHGLVYKAVSWGRIYTVTAAALDRYLFEIWAPIMPCWFGKDGISPAGFNVVQLQADAKRIATM